MARGERTIRPRFAEKAILGLFVQRSVRSQNLEGDVASHRVLPSAIYPPHRTGPEGGEDSKSPVDSAAQHRIAVPPSRRRRSRDIRVLGLGQGQDECLPKIGVSVAAGAE